MRFDMSKLTRPKVIDRLVFEATQDLETSDRSWWGVASFEAPSHMIGSRRKQFEGRTVGTPRPSVEIAARCVLLSEHLNDAIHHDGCWIAMVTSREAYLPIMHSESRYRQCRVLWADKDGDVQFAVHLDDFMTERALSHSVDVYTDACEDAWQRFKTAIHDVLDVQEDQYVTQH